MEKNNVNELIRVVENLEKNNFNDNHFLIKTSDILKSLKNYEVLDYIVLEFNEDIEEYEEIFLSDKEEYLNYLIVNDYINIENSKSDNTYNWNTNLTKDFYFKVYENELNSNILVELKVHLYGDIRCNYTDSILLEFNSIEQFWDVLNENNLYSTIEIDNIKYDLYLSVFSDCIEVNEVDTTDYFNVYEYEYKYIIEEIKKHNRQ